MVKKKGLDVSAMDDELFGGSDDKIEEVKEEPKKEITRKREPKRTKKPSPAGRKSVLNKEWKTTGLRFSPEAKKNLEVVAALTGKEQSIIVDEILSRELPKIIAKNIQFK